jgi:putative aldouronate transport system substrate-binding protein
MIKVTKALALVLALTMSATVLLTGCGAKQEETAAATKSEASAAPAATQEEVKEVTLNCYYPNSVVPNFDKVMEEVNKIAKEKINAKINFTLVDMAAYPQKLNMMISSGEPFDVGFSAYWGDFGFFQNAAKGAYLPLNDLLDKNAPASKAKVPASAWGAVTVNGKIYGIPNYQIWGFSTAIGVHMKKALVEKYNFDFTNIKSLKDLTPYLEAVKKGEPAGDVPFEASNSSLFTQYSTLFGMDVVGDAASTGWIKLDDASAKVINQYETQEFKDFVYLMRDWYNKGYIKKDAATLKDIAPDRKAGKVHSLLVGSIPDSVQMPELENKFSMSDPAANLYSVSKALMTPVIPAAKSAEAMVVVGANSPNPERALQWIELLNTDDKVWELINYGREGTDFTRVDERHIKRNLDSYNFNYMDWTIGQSNGRPQNYEDEGTNVVNKDKQLNIIAETDKTAPTSPLAGFVFNQEPVKTEIANCNTVVSEMLSALSAGSVDPAKFLPQFLDKLKTAGAEKVMAEKQTQIDAWKQANGK